jgi:hypothetical protein
MVNLFQNVFLCDGRYSLFSPSDNYPTGDALRRSAQSYNCEASAPDASAHEVA